ncbi:MAG TPA: manganese efflux pump MntP family protein [Clostridia bacterium]|nr:manganese efflux pump MntP family protein [Clostridia bacterium]
MSLAALGLLAVALGTDAFSMCIGLGIIGVSFRQIIIISFTILAFHVVMPLLGWYLGEYFGDLVGNIAVIIGAVILIALGIKMSWDARPSGNGSSCGAANEQSLVSGNALTGVGLFVMAACVSVDALSVGFTLGTRHVNLLMAAGVIGVVAGLMSSAGLHFGRMLGHLVGSRAQFIGGLILAGIGLHLLFQ